MVRAFTRQHPQLLEQIEAGVVVADVSGDIVAFNAGAERILGIDAEAAVGRPWTDFITVLHGGVVTAREVVAAAARPGGWHGLAEVRVRDGSSLRIRVHLQRVESPLLEAGRGHMAVFWPARERNAANGNGRKPAVRALPYRAFFHRSAEAIALSALGGLVLDANDATAELLGLPRDEIVGREFKTILTDWTPEDAAAIEADLRTKGSFTRTVTARRGGEPFPLEMSGTLLHEAGTEYVFNRLRDLSHERRLERMVDDLGELARLSEDPQDVREVSQRALDLIADSFGAHASMLVVTGPDGMRAVTGSNTSEAIRAALGGLDAGYNPLVRRLVESDEPFEARLPADESPPPWAERFHALRIRTVWAAPVWLRDRGDGAIVLMWRTPPAARFDAKQFGHMGRLAGVAIGNAVLREQMRREAERRARLEGPARIGGVVMAQMSDAIVTTGRDHRITAVNPAAERLFGLTADEAVGRRFADVLSVERMDGAPLGGQLLADVYSIGYWHGRVVERPKIGTATGRSMIVDLSLTVIRDEHREPTGTIALNREVTATARLENEAATLSSLTVATGRARTRREVAEAALERLCEATNADNGLITAIENDAVVVEASRGLSEELVTAIRLGRARSTPGGDPATDGSAGRGDETEFAPNEAIAAALKRDGVSQSLCVSLQVQGETIGMLCLGSRQPAWARPSDDVIVQAAGQVASALQNARLMERLDRGLRQERRLTAQLETLIDLTQLPEGDVTEETLSRFLLERVVKALDATAGFVAARRPDRDRFAITARWNLEPEGDLLESRPPDTYYFWRRLKETGRPFFVPIDDETVTAVAAESLRSAGTNGYAALPVYDGAELVATFVCHFPKPPEETVPADERTLDAVSRIINIAHANVRMGEGLAEAVEHERGLAAELRGLQELTLLGSTTDDIGELSRETIQAVARATGAPGAGYILLDDRTGRLETLVWFGVPPLSGPATRANSPTPETWSPFVHLDSGEAVCVCAPEADPAESTAAQAVLPLRVDGRLVGAIQLQWSGATQPQQLDLRYLAPIARIASISLANFRLRYELLQRAAAQRSLNSRLDALDELTRIGEEAASFEELAHRTVSLVRDALAANGVCYLLVEAGHHFETHAVAGETSTFRLWLKSVQAREAPGGSVLLSGGSSVLGDFVAGEVNERVLPIARATGFRSFGAIPIRVGEELAGALLCFFDRPSSTLTFDEGALDSVARIAGIALANFRLRERLVSSEERYRTLFEESPDACLVSALDGTVLDANDAAVRLYRVNRGEILGRYFGQLITADEREMARRRQIVWAEGRGTFRDRGRRIDGTEFPMELELRVVELGGQRRFLGLVRDLSDQERLQRELLQAQKMEALGQLVSGVAHELNNPLAAIIGFSQLLRTDERLPEDMKHNASLLVQEADRTRRIVQNLLDFARARPPERRPTRIAALVQSVLELQSYALTTHNIDVTLDIAEGLPEVDLDRAQLQQVLLNLTINAIQAIKGDFRTRRSLLTIAAELGRTTIDTPAEDGAEAPAGRPKQASEEDAGRHHADGETIRISITDDGPGVPEAARARLFDPFFTTKQPGEGTGLGLSVSFGIVAAHGGHLWYEPGPGGVGSRFWIELPVHAAVDGSAATPIETPGMPGPRSVAASARRGAPASRSDAPADTSIEPPAGSAPEAPSPAAASAASAWRARILALDDESSIRTLLGRALRANNMDCIAFEDGGEALEAIARETFDVMLIDHRMAGMSGTEFFEAATKMRPELADRAVFMSGDVLNPDLRGFATQRGIRLLSKPFDLEAVTSVVREVLAATARR